MTAMTDPTGSSSGAGWGSRPARRSSARLAEEEAFGVGTAPRWPFGAFVNPDNERMTFAEAQGPRQGSSPQVGRRLEITSTFVAWDEPFPNAGHSSTGTRADAAHRLGRPPGSDAIGSGR